jgi:hypothetical protein
MRFADPFRRKIPSTSVAVEDRYVRHRELRESTRPQTFLLQKHSAFSDYDGNVSIYETLSVITGEGYRNVCIFDANVKRYSKDTRRSLHWV